MARPAAPLLEEPRNTRGPKARLVAALEQRWLLASGASRELVVGAGTGSCTRGGGHLPPGHGCRAGSTLLPGEQRERCTEYSCF